MDVALSMACPNYPIVHYECSNLRGENKEKTDFLIDSRINIYI